jgi:hypothetical protein
MGIGAGGGYVNVDAGSDQSYEELQLRMNWRATDKLRFSVNVGGEDRQFLNVPTFPMFGSTNKVSAASDLLTPIFGASIEYQPFQDTQISLSGSRNISPSLLDNEVTETTTIGVSLTQVLLKKFQLELGVGYNQTDYHSTVHIFDVTLNNTRTDEYYFFSARLSHPFLRRGTWGISYQYNDNQSTDTDYSYRGSQIGFDISYRY